MKPDSLNLSRARGFLSLTQGERVLIERIAVADRFLERGRGLMFRNRIPGRLGAGYFFPNCRVLHTCFMRFNLDIVFVDVQGQAVHVHRGTPPFRMIRGPDRAAHCLEVKGGTFPEIEATCLKWSEVA